jgi:putative OmpL-like beta-barrel porin-2
MTEHPMWLILCFACAGLGFMLYVLVHFWAEPARGKRFQRPPVSSLAKRAQSGRVVMFTPLEPSIKDRSRMKESALMRTAGAALLFAAMNSLACNERAFGQTTEMHVTEYGGHQADRSQVNDLAASEQDASDAPMATPPDPRWAYGGFLDAAYLLDLNHPANHLFRSRGTAYKVDEPILNMEAAYARKSASETSPWGMEFTLQGGQDSRIFGFSATAPNLPGSEWLRHLGPTDVSYLAPLGKGLTVQAGLFSSLIGYDSLYAKDNFNYTRPWGADFTPYLMMGVNTSYPLTKKLTGAVFVVNGYWHLADANHVPSSGAQVAYKVTNRTTIKETVLFGPHQSDTRFEFWRFLWDSIAEWKTDRLTTAFEYHVGTEKITTSGNPRALWTGAQLPVHWVFNNSWSATVRPEVYWDRDARLTGFQQTVKANTTTLEYRVPYRQASAIVRLEHRIDDSRGPGGGFFRGREIAPGVVSLTPTQNLLILGVIMTFNSHF